MGNEQCFTQTHADAFNKTIYEYANGREPYQLENEYFRKN
jgi:hypothetical protein